MHVSYMPTGARSPAILPLREPGKRQGTDVELQLDVEAQPTVGCEDGHMGGTLHMQTYLLCYSHSAFCGQIFHNFFSLYDFFLIQLCFFLQGRLHCFRRWVEEDRRKGKRRQQTIIHLR